MVVGCVNFVTKGNNNVIIEGGYSEDISPASLFTKILPPDYHTIIALNFRDCVQVYDDTTNTNCAQLQGAIALYPSSNLQGYWIFMSLRIVREIHRHY
mmetsp:Transcript_5603/g.5241  ORF Transcript_5603/g.5241 Transcript_5603/m.5241 type:complete len:98 (+) Transcript_5603:234-527(+)